MEDSKIVDLYWDRNEQAIGATAAKYGKYCFMIAHNILFNHEDADECVNDTYMRTWEQIPPHRPAVLSTFLGKITRRISLNRWRDQRRQKRGGGELTLALDELKDCISTEGCPERELAYKELTCAVNAFLGTLPQEERDVFICRYWFLASIRQISASFAFTENKTKSMLFHTREKLREYLRKECFL